MIHLGIVGRVSLQQLFVSTQKRCGIDAALIPDQHEPTRRPQDTCELGADVFAISTSIERVALDWGRPTQRFVDRLTLEEARSHLAEGTHFASGSMAPKIEAIIAFLEHGGREALITNPENIDRAMEGKTGTRITRQ